MFWRWLFDNLLWEGCELLAKLGIGWLTKRLHNWENKQLQSRLSITHNPTFMLEKLTDKEAHLSITIPLWSSIASRLQPNLVIGRIETKDFWTKLRWEKEEENIFGHIIEDVTQNENKWMFYVTLSIDTMKKHVASNWFIDFKAIFQNEMSITFKHIRFNLRDSDVRRITEG